MDQKSMLKPIVQAVLLCCMMTVKTADCAAPIKLIHVVSESCAGYLFNVTACRVLKIIYIWDMAMSYILSL